ncbi:MAG: hypothetical protein JSW07_09970 [bacterium]|nr:MAG: hypothetical protein JSW07_09970 [bacterium]
MPKRKTEKEVRAFLTNLDLELLNEYVNVKTELEVSHVNCGHIFSRSLNHLYKNSKCPKCHPPKTVRKDIEEVRKVVESKPGHKLLSKKYVNNKSPIEIYCQIANKKHVTTLHGYENHKGCGACRFIRLKETWKPRHQKKLEKMNSEMAKEGYKLIAKKYIGNKHPLDYICSNGHKGKVSWNNWSSGARCLICEYDGRRGEGSSAWKGGLTKRNLYSYDAAVQYLEKAEKIRRDPAEPDVLQARCNKCGKYFRPTRRAVGIRIMALNAADGGEGRLYCSEKCKQECPVFRTTHIKCQICGKDVIGKGGIKYCDDCTSSRETFSLKQKQIIFQRDLKFGWVEETSTYEIHHILNVADFPEYAKKVWNGWAVNSEYHGDIHNYCGLGRKDIYNVDERYFEVAINKLLENKAPKEVIEFVKIIYEDAANLKCDD